MNEFSNPTHKKSFSRDAIIGLGEDSIRKNYYPELQDRLLELEKINSRTRALITTIPDMLFISDLSGNISPFNLSKKRDISLYTSIMRNSTLINELRSCIFEVIETMELKEYTFSLDIKKILYHFEARIHISEFKEVLIIIRDITEQVNLEKNLRHLAEKDTLCNVYNRRYFENHLLTIKQLENINFAIIIIDIDGLKLVNDTLGHYRGDQFIMATASLLESSFSHLGLIARIGGDEFGIVILNQPINVIEEALKQLQLYVAESNKDHEAFGLSLSFGYGYHSTGLINIDMIFQIADNNMFQNKLLKATSVKHNLVKTLMKTLEAKDYITEGHADRMETLSDRLCQVLSFTQSRIDRIQLLVKFHDIGKVGIPDSILKKPGSLSLDEWIIMKSHSQIGERIANESSDLKDIASLILKHHEKWDGSGYPLGLSGESIPIECRVLSIVDAYDAMTNDRPYRKALSHDCAIKELIAYRGKQFDPTLVDLFVHLSFENLIE